MKVLTQIQLKNHPKYDERWLQNEIAKNPSLLGLGNLELRDKEKIQSSGGRLDLLFEDVESSKRYECELQLGAVDESHIIRTIEYWDLERKRYPQYDHTAVLVAEDVSSRFLNVVQLFNGHIPLIVLKMTTVEVGDDVSVFFTKVIDEVQLGVPDDEELGEPTDRNYWEKRSCHEMMTLMDSFYTIIQEIDPVVKPNYLKHYIGLMRNNIATNYCWFQPAKKFVKFICRPIPSDDLLKIAEEAGLDLERKTKWRELHLRFPVQPTEDQREVLKAIIRASKDSYGV